MAYWKINCMAKDYAGLWQTWFIQQTVALGWPPPKYSLRGGITSDGWRAARRNALEIHPGDKIVVQLSDSHIGRIGTVFSTVLEDDDWHPTVPRDKKNPAGEMGRRIQVRWNLALGPIEPSAIAKLPESLRFKGGTLRRTVVRLSDSVGEAIEKALADKLIWTSLESEFASELALSDYIGAFPFQLEDGLRPYPQVKRIREFRFKNLTRSDVLLLDQRDNLVIVECKQGSPTLADLAQVRRYVALARKEILGAEKREIRAVLVHGGARKVDIHVAREALCTPPVELVRFEVKVDFAISA